jgi:hypothetical protein
VALEITHGAGAVYRINPRLRTEIQMRKAVRGSRWRHLRRCATEEQAAQELLRLGDRGAGDSASGEQG